MAAQTKSRDALVAEARQAKGEGKSRDEAKAVVEEYTDATEAESIVGEVYGPAPGEIEFVTARYAKENPRPEVVGFWGEILVPGEATAPVARGGVGKTEFTRNVMLRSAEGNGTFLDRAFPSGPVSWAYFTREGAGDWWLRQLHRTADALDFGDDVLERIHLADWADDCGLYLTNTEHLDRVRRGLDRLKEGPGVDVVAFDPFTDFKSGSDNDDEAMAAAFESIKALCREYEIAAWPPHHASQNGEGLDAARGSTKFEGTVAAQLELTDKVKDPGGGEKLPETVRRVRLVKNRYGPKTTHYLDFNPDTHVYSDRAKPGVTAATVAALREAGEPGASIADLVKQTKNSDSAIRDAVKAMEGEGKVEVAGKDRRTTLYRLTESGYRAAGLGM